MAHRLSAEAESQLDAIWLHVAIESGALESADRIIDTITDRFWLLARYPHIGRRPGAQDIPKTVSVLADFAACTSNGMKTSGVERNR